MNPIELLEREQMRMDIPDFLPGDTVKVHVKIREGEKERLQALFQGPGGIEGRHHQTGRLTIGTFFIVHSPVLGL